MLINHHGASWRAGACASGRRAQRGLSLVELMVGIAIGLLVVAGATLVVSTQLGENRRLLLETQLQQDLRATADIITRELRRAGADTNAVMSVWSPGSLPNAPTAVGNVTVSVGQDQVVYNYVRPGVTGGPYGFKLDSGVIKSMLGNNNWQELTDRNTMEVTAFQVAPVEQEVYTMTCPKGCGGNPADESCWPTVTLRSYQIDIQARARTDHAVQRSIRTEVRLRNDLIAFNDPANPSLACPS